MRCSRCRTASSGTGMRSSSDSSRRAVCSGVSPLSAPPPGKTYSPGYRIGTTSRGPLRSQFCTSRCPMSTSHDESSDRACAPRKSRGTRAASAVVASGACLANALVRGAEDVAVFPRRAVKAAIGLSLERVEGARQAHAAVRCVGQALAVIGASRRARDFG